MNTNLVINQPQTVSHKLIDVSQVDGLFARYLATADALIDRKRGMADNTKSAYKQRIASFATYLGERPFDADALDDWLMDLERGGYSAATINLSRAAVAWLASEIKEIARRLTAENNLESFVRAEVINRADAVCGVGGVKVQNNLVGTRLSKTEVEELMASPLTERQRVVLTLGFGCGLRISEIHSLSENDIFKMDDRLWVNVVDSKGGKSRSVPVPHRIKSVLIGFGGFDCSKRTLQRDVESAGGLGLTSHDMRRTYGRMLFDGGVDLLTISQLLGHASVDQTAQYIGCTINQDSVDILGW